jgi:hypothetical protein
MWSSSNYLEEWYQFRKKQEENEKKKSLSWRINDSQTNFLSDIGKLS